ncbi:gliding motility-associated C-terminal domain-containing protein [Mucilaginibacter aquariorum]|uniref:Gliding motility-associated C-terminal domain-containing protein n=1 Tax=Mucilaginibacter aquariorum TaxID=2967225 RepID=A0ABT1SY31_9SPHI|nr:gliding motility-associated C-terminal domain-containing protein [Mucilaginibacter aquariorum]MCQ6957251.1 gliding motility-associated C-terminal domain-containing protein [Mucilaginibacter aquariorum]
MRSLSYIFLFTLLFFVLPEAYAQQDIEFHLNATLLPGKNILKVKRDFNDPYLWVLAENNEVYRINSLDNSITDLSPLFKPYPYTFTDIAGQNKDVVFIVTGTNTILQYKNGIIKLIGQSNGIAGAVNSIGITDNFSYYVQPYFPTALDILNIGTDQGIYKYNIANETATAQFTNNIDKPARIYDATYRSTMQTYNFIPYNQQDTIHYYSVLSNGYHAEFLWGGGSFGEHIYTATETTAIIDHYTDLVSYQMLFFGTEKGLYEIGANGSHNSGTAHKRFLPGQKVNKVATIYGLTSFGNGNQFFGVGQIKENLLVGTDEGLYFSNSFYNTFGKLYGSASIELLPYAPLNGVVINDVCVNHVLNSNPICEDGVWVAAKNGLHLLKPDYGKFFGAQQLEALHFEDDYGNLDEKEICSDGSVKLTINAGDYAGNTIQWYRNGSELTGIRERDLEVNEAGDYYAVVYDPCGAEHMETNHLKVKKIAGPEFIFAYNDKVQVCENAPFSLEVQGSAAYQYRWYRDGVLTDEIGQSITVNSNGKYKVVVSACADNGVQSKEVQVEFVTLPTAIIKKNKQLYCIGDQAVLSTDIAPNGAYTLNWLRNGVPIEDSADKTSLSVTQSGAYSIVIKSNLINCSRTIVPVNIAFTPPPTLSVEKTSITSFCDGETIVLKATYSSGKLTWSTGETTDEIKVKTPGHYTAIVKSGDCVKEESRDVLFFPKPSLALANASLCPFTGGSVILEAPSGFNRYQWNGVDGSESFTTGTTGTVTLTVTDANGCTASQVIRVASDCPDIRFANTFTPNGDGVNDTWNIAGLGADRSISVTIFNRYGASVFEERGYATPWDGTSRGKNVPAGVYYYVISIKESSQVLTGSLAVIY